MDRLSGELVTLRPLKDEDYDYITSLRNDTRTQARGLRLAPSFTARRVKADLEKAYEGPNRGIWIIETKRGDIVGDVSYWEEPPRLAASLGIMTGVEHWGKGFGGEALGLVIRFLFEERGVQSVSLWTTSWNVRMVGLAEKLGFRISVREREARELGGNLHDGLFMDLLREEYCESRGRQDEMVFDREFTGG